MLSETSCMVWYKALEYNHLGIGIRSCRLFTMTGPDFAREQRFFIAFTYQQICLSFSQIQPKLHKYLQIPTFKTHTLVSTVTVSILCSYLFMPEREKNCKQTKKEEKSCLQGCLLFIWLFIEENCSKAHGNCSYCKLLKRQHLIDVFWRSLLTCLTTGF